MINVIFYINVNNIIEAGIVTGCSIFVILCGES